jgi:hypothetical protein
MHAMQQHEQTRQRRDSLQIAAAVCVGVLLTAQVALLAWVFREHRSRRMRVQATEVVEVAPAANHAAPATNHAAVAAVSGVVTARVPVASQPVLNPSLKIQRLEREGAFWRLRLRAQTGELQFEPGAARASVEWRLADGSTRLEWIALPAAWENFAVKMLTARYDGDLSLLRGCTARTFYREQLQDMVTIEIPTP